jgi:hypothetical protein
MDKNCEFSEKITGAKKCLINDDEGLVAVCKENTS